MCKLKYYLASKKKNMKLFNLTILLFATCYNQIYAQEIVKNNDANGNTYVSYSNDPSNSRWYTLENGLTVILAENHENPRVQTLIGTKAGSSSDPAENTGLAHYLEHMLFKGTDRYGTLDFEKEKVLLAQIDNLYEQYNSTKNETKRKEIYSEIDRVSGEAAKFAIANEYDKLLQGIGATGTNAFTSFEQTVYVNNIPSNQIANWLDIEAERFRNPILRLFHTELEAVYEEKNRSLDNDNRTVYEKLLEASFPNHNYGKQTTIGTIEHLKNPSLVKIREYYNTFYVPNNMAIIMVGDLDIDNTIKQIKQDFAYMKTKPVPKITFPEASRLEQVQRIEVVGPSQESMMIGYRVPDALDDKSDLVTLIDLILSNSSAGLIDLNMVKAQKCIRAYSSTMLLKERGLHYFAGSPLEGQTLEELENLFYEQIELLKNGEFDMSLLKSIVLNEKVQNIRQFRSYQSTAYSLLDAFIMGGTWSKQLSSLDNMLNYSKEDIVSFAKEYYRDGRIVVYKRQGKKEETVKVEKPEITKVEVNRGKTSPFVSEILGREQKPVSPQVLKYENEIEFGDLDRRIPIWKVKNSDNQLFTMYYVLDLGSRHDQKLALAVEYLEYLGTDKYSAEDISKAFYDLACNFGVSTGAEQSYVYISGLASSFDEAAALFEHLLANAKPYEEKLEQFIAQKMKSRNDAKLNKNAIMYRLRSYSLYGEDNPSKYMMSENELNSVSGRELTDYIHNLTSYKHKIWYNGPLSLAELNRKLTEVHKTPKTMLPTPEMKTFEMKETGGTVYTTHYDMVQAEVMWVKKSSVYNLDESAKISLFNEYFGGGMSSIVFQEIREAKALAYSTYSSYRPANKLDKNNTVLAYVGTQADKMQEAIKGMNELLTTLPVDQKTFDNGKQSLKQGLATSRILKMNILFDYDQSLKLDVSEDRRVAKREALEAISLDDIIAFHKARINSGYNYAVLGDQEKLNLSFLSTLGNLQTLSLEQLFGY